MKEQLKCDFHGCENTPTRRYWGRADGVPNHCCQTHYEMLRSTFRELLKPPPASEAMNRVYELIKQLTNAYHKANMEHWRSITGNTK
jgi:hypothetical protein